MHKQFTRSSMLAVTCALAALSVTATVKSAIAADDGISKQNTTTTSAQQSGGNKVRVLVMGAPTANKSDVTEQFEQLLGTDQKNGRIVRTIGQGAMTTYVLEVDDAKASEIVGRMSADRKHFAAVEKSVSFQTQQFATIQPQPQPGTLVTGMGNYSNSPLPRLFNDPIWRFQKHLNTIRFNQLVQRIGKSPVGSQAIQLGIVDSGIAGTNVDVRALYSVDCTIENNGQPIVTNGGYDQTGHGTAMAATAAGASDNLALGASPGYGVPLVSLKVVNHAGEVRDEALINALLFAGSHNIKVLNCSFNAPPPNTLANAQAFAPVLSMWMNWYANGRNSCRGIIVTSSGNFPYAQDNSPRFFAPYLVSVAATTYDDAPTDFTTLGSRIDLAAPGSLILTSLRDGTTGMLSGTSLSSALVSGSIARVWSYRPSVPNVQVVEALRNSARFPMPRPFPGAGTGILRQPVRILDVDAFSRQLGR